MPTAKVRNVVIDLFLLSIGSELLEVGPKVGDFLVVFDPREKHFGIGNLGARILDVVPECFLAPADAGSFEPFVILKSASVPALRPSRPLSGGPSLFFAFSPTSWHGWHFRNDVSPAEVSCANAAPPEIANIK